METDYIKLGLVKLRHDVRRSLKFGFGRLDQSIDHFRPGFKPAGKTEYIANLASLKRERAEKIAPIEKLKFWMKISEKS